MRPTKAAPAPTAPAAAILEPALARRVGLIGSNTTAYRLLHRDADGVPGLALDRFGDCLIAHLYDGLAPDPSLLAAAQQTTSARAVYVKHRPAQASRLTEAERAALAPTTPLLGRPIDATHALENGAVFEIRPGAGLSVGLFLDMREVRAAVRASVKGLRVLNCFAYTCGFGVAAGLGGASEVVNVDVSQPVLAWGARNYALNGLAAERADFIFGDVFDWLGRFARRGRQFDLVIVDPPPFATTRNSRFSITRDLGRLIAQAAACVVPGGRLLACANAAELLPAMFDRALVAELGSRRARIVDRWHEPDVDFPRPRGTAPYLKVSLLEL